MRVSPNMPVGMQSETRLYNGLPSRLTMKLNSVRKRGSPVVVPPDSQQDTRKNERAEALSYQDWTGVRTWLGKPENFSRIE
jgi:hypothetical protein